NGLVSSLYTAATPPAPGQAATPAQVVIAGVSVTGVDPGEILALTCEVAPGTVADISYFQVTVLSAIDPSALPLTDFGVSLGLVADLTPPALMLSTLPDQSSTTAATLIVTGRASDDSGIPLRSINGLGVP